MLIILICGRSIPSGICLIILDYSNARRRKGVTIKFVAIIFVIRMEARRITYEFLNVMINEII